MTHLIDTWNNCGRANIRRLWTMCGQARATRLVKQTAAETTCDNCLVKDTERRELLVADHGKGGK